MNGAEGGIGSGRRTEEEDFVNANDDADDVLRRSAVRPCTSSQEVWRERKGGEKRKRITLTADDL